MFRMDRLIVGEIVAPFLFGLCLFTSLFFMGGEIVRLTEFLSLGVPPVTVGRLLVLTLPNIVLAALPMAMLLAALLGFGRLSNDSEIVALVAAGVSFSRLVAPLALFASGVTLIGLWFGDSLVPAANRGRETIIREVREGLGGGRSATAFTVPVRRDGFLTMLVHVEGGVDLVSRSLRDVSIETWERGTMTGAVYARRAEWIVGTRNWRLFDFTAASLTGETRGVLSGASGRTVEGIGTPQDLASLQQPVKEVSSRTLRERARLYRVSGSEDRAREAEVEVAHRVALPFASLVFALVGAPLGVRPQRAGKGVGFGLAILIIFGYWIALQIVSFMGKSGALPPLLALSLPNLAGITAAIYLVRRVLR